MFLPAIRRRSSKVLAWVFFAIFFAFSINIVCLCFCFKAFVACFESLLHCNMFIQ